VENWKIKIVKLEFPVVEGSETLMWRVFAIFFIYFIFFKFSSFHFISVWGTNPGFFQKPLLDTEPMPGAYYCNYEH
jgi:hypothetical protein